MSSGQGFTFEDLKAEIDAGYPVLLFLQLFDQKFRSLSGMERANPNMHGMLAYGYYTTDSGAQFVRYRTSWASGDNMLSKWEAEPWQAALPVRGVIGYHPLPQIINVLPSNDSITISWQGPSSMLSNVLAQTTMPLHWYVVEKATTLNPPDFSPVSAPTVEQTATIPLCCDQAAFFRLKLMPPPSSGISEPLVAH